MAQEPKKTNTPPAPDEPKDLDPNSIEGLQAQLKAMQEQVADADRRMAKAGVGKDMDEEVAWRVRAGLSHEEATRVVRRNKATVEAAKIKDPTERQAAMIAAGGLI